MQISHKVLLIKSMCIVIPVLFFSLFLFAPVFPAALKLIAGLVTLVAIFFNLSANRICPGCGRYNWGITVHQCSHCETRF